MTMDKHDEELEPLFDYSRVQPINVFVDDDDDVVPLAFFPGGKRKRSSNPDLEDGKENGNKKVVMVVDCDNNDKEDKEDDWMPLPPPLIPDVGVGAKDDAIIREIRLRKQELASFAQPSEDVLKAVMESAKKELHKSSEPVVLLDIDKPPIPERQKILISIQDKEGQKAFRMYMDDKLERLFKMYADKVELKLESLVFLFDGEKLNPTATPATAGLEDADIIEVHIKSQ